MTGALVVALVVGLVAAFGLTRRRRNGVGVRVAADSVSGFGADALDVRLGGRATLVQFSSRVCAPCRATRRILADLVACEPGLVHVELDVDEHLRLAAEHHVTRTPTVLLVDGAGAVVRRFVGPSRLPEFRQALAELS